MIFFSFLFYFSRWYLGSWKTFHIFLQRGRKWPCCPSHLCWFMMWQSQSGLFSHQACGISVPWIIVTIAFFVGEVDSGIMPLIFMAGEFQENVQLSFYYSIGPTSALTNSAESLVSFSSSAPNLTLVVSLYLHCFSIQLSSCTPYFHRATSRSLPHSHFLLQCIRQLFLLYTIYPNVDASRPVRVLLRTSLWLNTPKSAISKWHPRHIFSGILWLSSCWPEVFSLDICDCPELPLPETSSTKKFFKPSILPLTSYFFLRGKPEYLILISASFSPVLSESLPGLYLLLSLVEIELSLNQILLPLYTKAYFHTSVV